jgi:hypothetical protein
MNAREFYIGGGRVGPRLKWILRGIVVFVLLMTGFDAWLVAAMQPTASDGVRAHKAREFIGTLTRDPYPMLRIKTSDGFKTYLLAAEGKHGAAAALGVTPDGPVTLSGFLISRAGLDLIELATNDAVVIAETPTIAEPARELHGSALFSGEIVDAKSWLGAMRPGDGHVLKGSASLSILGGIPPLFVTRDVTGAVKGLMLLTQADSSAVPADAVTAFVEEPVSVNGTVEKRGDLLVLKADLLTLKPLH